ncbi:MAG: glycosyltransferase [Candidatus Jordarchaeum sp.]|uniref:glycosyltransferase n=1 Tax=Candidatus Jordarchaeum sp. TaxID=2823881 RepID=UPI00404B9D92
MVKISVIIPTLNEESYLPCCIKSILNQSLRRNMYEIIVADSHSSDKTPQIAKKYADYLLDVPRKGAGAARNAGAEIAKGKILLFLDADTMIRRNLMNEVLKSFNEKQIVGGTCDIYPSDGTSFGNAFFKLINIIYRIVYLFGRPHAQTKCCFYRKDVFTALKGFTEDLIVTEDQEIAWRAGKIGKMIYLKTTSAYSSMRREKTLGYTKTLVKWVKNYFNVLLFKQSEHFWHPIR